MRVICYQLSSPIRVETSTLLRNCSQCAGPDWLFIDNELTKLGGHGQRLLLAYRQATQ